METKGESMGDGDLRDRILSGVAAAAALQERFRKPLEGYLSGLCDRGDGRSQEKAVEIVSQLLADCFTKSPSLLERWHGTDNLDAFLRTAAANRLKSFWVSAEKLRTTVDSESRNISTASALETGSDAEDLEINTAEEALRSGVARAAADCPEGLVFLRLKGLHGVDQRAISQCWGHHEAQTSRRIKEAMGIIRTVAKDHLECAGLELPIEILQETLQRKPGILLGGEGAPFDSAYDLTLRQLASGKSDARARSDVLQGLCKNPRLLEFFAQLLNRSTDQDAVFVRDPELSGMDARLAECVQRSLEILHPSEAPGLITPLMTDLFTDALYDIGADGGTLWLLCPGEASLEAVFNPLEPEITGKRQPLVSGIVSLVLATGEACTVTGVEQHTRHSPAIDIALGKTTLGMIAVPFVPGGSTRGVLTAVRFKSGDGFTARETGIITRQALVMAELFATNLAKRITG